MAEKNIITDFLDKYLEYTYAICYTISGIVIDKTENISVEKLKEAYEIRLFSDDKERHIFEYDGKIKCADIDDKDNKKDIHIKKYPVRVKYSHLGRYILVQEYLDYDEDGQVFVERTRLKGFE